MLRKRNGSEGRPACTNQHSPLISPAKSPTTTSATDSAGMIGMPSLSRASRIGPMIADSAKPGQTAL